MNFRAFHCVVTTAQIAALLVLQCVAPVATDATAHAPLGDCAAVHQCGCPAEKTARGACCCSHSTPGPAKKTPLAKFISAVHCSGPSQSPGAVTAHCDFALPTDAWLIDWPRPGSTVVVVRQTQPSRDTEPPDPPPKLFSPC